jgi:hypothetical protein
MWYLCSGLLWRIHAGTVLVCSMLKRMRRFASTVDYLHVFEVVEQSCHRSARPRKLNSQSTNQHVPHMQAVYEGSEW